MLHNYRKYIYFKMNKNGEKIIPLHGLHIVFPEEREMGKMQFGSQFNFFQSTITYIVSDGVTIVLIIDRKSHAL